MCRLTAVICSNEPILLADILTKPRMSIIDQSFNSRVMRSFVLLPNVYGYSLLWSLGAGTQPGSSQRLPEVLSQWLCLEIRSSLRLSMTCTVPCTHATGDGFGVGWYVPDESARLADAPECPCVFTSLKPAWSDRNLRMLAEKVISPLIFAHVRAAGPSSGIPTELNCHPFVCGKFMFMHNGCIGDFLKVRRRLLTSLNDDAFNFAVNNVCVDSVLIFAVFISELHRGVLGDYTANELRLIIERTISIICRALEEAGVVEPTTMNLVISDGRHLVATRHALGHRRGKISSSLKSKASIVHEDGEEEDIEAASLYFATGTRWQQLAHQPDMFQMTHSDKRNEVAIITSEPLTDVNEEWVPVPINHVVVVTATLDVLVHKICSTVPVANPIMSLPDARADKSAVANAEYLAFRPGSPLLYSIHLTKASKPRSFFRETVSPVTQAVSELPFRPESITQPSQILRCHNAAILCLSSLSEISLRSNIRVIYFPESTDSPTGSSQRVGGTWQILEGPDTEMALDLIQSWTFSGGQDGSICLWESESLICRHKLQGHLGGVLSLAVYVQPTDMEDIRDAMPPDGNSGIARIILPRVWLFSGSSDTTICVWNITHLVYQDLIIIMANKQSSLSAARKSSRRCVCWCGIYLCPSLLLHGFESISVSSCRKRGIVSLRSSARENRGSVDEGSESTTRTSESLGMQGHSVQGEYITTRALALRLRMNPLQGDVLSLTVHHTSNDEVGKEAPEDLNGAAIVCTQNPLMNAHFPSNKCFLYVGFQTTAISFVKLSDLFMYADYIQSLLISAATAVSIASECCSATNASNIDKICNSVYKPHSADFATVHAASNKSNVLTECKKSRTYEFFDISQTQRDRRYSLTHGLCQSAKWSDVSSPGGCCLLCSCSLPMASQIQELASELRDVTLNYASIANPDHGLAKEYSVLSAELSWASASSGGAYNGAVSESDSPVSSPRKFHFFEANAPRGIEGHHISSTGSLAAAQSRHNSPITRNSPFNKARGEYPACGFLDDGHILEHSQPTNSEDRGRSRNAPEHMTNVSVSRAESPTSGYNKLIVTRFDRFEVFRDANDYDSSKNNLVQTCPASHKFDAGAGLVCWLMPTVESQRHFGFVESLVACGNYLCSGGGDGLLKLWRNNRLAHTFIGHSGGILSLAADSPSHLVYSGSRDKTIRVWCLTTRSCKQILQCHTSDVLSLCLCGPFLLSGSAKGEILLWCLTTYNALCSLRDCEAPPLCAGATVSSSQWFSATSLLAIPVTADGHLLTTDSRFSGRARSSDVRVYAAGGDGMLRVWNVPKRHNLPDQSLDGSVVLDH